jgi:hypothetical protein
VESRLPSGAGSGRGGGQDMHDVIMMCSHIVK